MPCIIGMHLNYYADVTFASLSHVELRFSPKRNSNVLSVTFLAGAVKPARAVPARDLALLGQRPPRAPAGRLRCKRDQNQPWPPDSC